RPCSSHPAVLPCSRTPLPHPGLSCCLSPVSWVMPRAGCHPRFQPGSPGTLPQESFPTGTAAPPRAMLSPVDKLALPSSVFNGRLKLTERKAGTRKNDVRAEKQQAQECWGMSSSRDRWLLTCSISCLSLV
uniref:Uncharacterized protein n=1 Tax=Chelydra serpentina TaxID=8475 RepID=A0A8C3XNF0_CHESE